MAEILKYTSGLPSFSEVLEIISRWSGRETLAESERKQAREELNSCIQALENKTDGMSGMVRVKVAELLQGLR